MLNLSRIFPTYLCVTVVTLVQINTKKSLLKSFILNLAVSMSFTTSNTFSSLAVIINPNSRNYLVMFCFSCVNTAGGLVLYKLVLG